MKKLLAFIFVTLFASATYAQEINTFSVHQIGVEEPVHIDIEDMDSVFMDVQDGTQMMNVRLTDSSVSSYSMSGIDYMDFIYVERGPQAVDLGLTSMWATYNLGASSPEESGDFFAWGETATKTVYTEDSYLYYKNNTYEKIGNNISGTEYDAATSQWGYPWRMPNRYEINELMQCDWKKETMNGIDGYSVTGKNGNSIFLPAAGYMNGTECLGADKYQGYYWSSAVNKDMPSAAYNINFKGYDAEWSASRFYGFSIRPVRDY